MHRTIYTCIDTVYNVRSPCSPVHTGNCYSHRVKKPAGAVSLFGGVDLLGGRTKSTEVGGGAKKEAPPTSRKPRGSSGLFGDVEEGEEDIFAFTGKKRFVFTLCVLLSGLLSEALCPLWSVG